MKTKALVQKRALIVGVNDYAPVGAGGPDLNGCVNDARDMANTLVICGFAPGSIQILTNQNATRANIVNRLTHLVNSSVSGDSIVFYYSGHGTRVANVGADFEVDGLDEAICPHDFQTGGVIRDDDFRAIFAGLRSGVNLEVIFDCCHSGTGTKALLIEGAGSVLDMPTPRFLMPNLEDEFYFNFQKEIATEKPRVLMTTKALVPTPGMNHTLWAACKDNQVAMEGSFDGLTRGYFTYHFCKILRATSGNIVRSRLDTLTANALSGMGAAQVNQTEGTAIEMTQRIFT